MQGIAVIAAAGRGERAGIDKVWADLGGVPMIARTVEPFLRSFDVDAIVLVVSRERENEAKALFAKAGKPLFVVVGGATRTQSVRAALEKVKSIAKEDAVVAVHDGARPFVTPSLIQEGLKVASESGSAIPALPCTDSLRRVSEKGSAALSREDIRRVQTPQCFRFRDLLKAYSHADEATDDAALYEKYVGPVTLIQGDEKNKKITYLSDIYEQDNARVGVGFDVHELVPERPLILGGVSIPHDKGLLGHSDADALAHAIMDALLTAAHLPDIGHLFPPDDPAYEGADSMVLMKEVLRKVKAEGWRVANVSAEIMAEKPKMAPYLAQMEQNIASTLELTVDRVKLAATTTEKLGIVGEEKGIAAHAVALLARTPV